MKQNSHSNQYETIEQANQDKTEVYKTVVRNIEKNYYFLCVYSASFARKYVYTGIFFEVIN